MHEKVINWVKRCHTTIRKANDSFFVSICLPVCVCLCLLSFPLSYTYGLVKEVRGRRLSLRPTWC